MSHARCMHDAGNRPGDGLGPNPLDVRMTALHFTFGMQGNCRKTVRGHTRAPFQSSIRGGATPAHLGNRTVYTLHQAQHS